jgi:hypothetical protein
MNSSRGARSCHRLGSAAQILSPRRREWAGKDTYRHGVDRRLAVALISAAGLLWFGLVTMALAVGGLISLGTRLDRRRGWVVMACALAAGPLILAWFNRHGPGRVWRTFPLILVSCVATSSTRGRGSWPP